MRIDQIALDLLEDLEQNEEPKGFNRIHRQDDQRAGQPANRSRVMTTKNMKPRMQASKH